VEEVRLKHPQSAAEVEHYLDIWLYPTLTVHDFKILL